MKDLQVFVYRFVNVEVKRLNIHGHSDIKNWENIVLGWKWNGVQLVS